MFVVLFVLFVFGSVRGYEECGILPPNAKRHPWEAGIYGHAFRTDRCLFFFSMGSLVSDKVIITAKFNLTLYFNQYFDPGLLFVTVGKLSKEWVKPSDDFTQTSRVKEFHVAPDSRRTNIYANDIAVLIVEESFRFNQFIRPVCLDFHYDFEQKQLQSLSKGKTLQIPLYRMIPYTCEDTSIHSYSWTQEDFFTIKNPSNVLPVDCWSCVEGSLTDRYFMDLLYIQSVTDDRTCALKDVGVPPGNPRYSGFGVAFPETINGTERYYLRGVNSVRRFHFSLSCNDSVYHEFTSVRKHESFIRKFWNESWSVNNQGLAGKCKLPPFPEHGSYTTNVTNLPATPPGAEESVLVELTVNCRGGYGVQGVTTVSCYNGFWPERVPACVRMCPLTPHPSVEYRCLLSGDVVGWRACGALEKMDTIVSPVCRKPHYHSYSTLPLMRCQADGSWNYVARCQPECGLVTSKGTGLAVGGVPAKRGELPWHVGVYMKTFTPYMQVCGGSLITNKIIISAGHCFWSDEEKLPAEQFAVAAGKLYRPWGEGRDDEQSMQDAQKSDVKEIHLPPRFRGAFSNFQDDIAVVLAAKEFQYRTFVRPVCLSFDSNFDKLQLQTVNKGKVAGWGLTAADGKPSPVLQVVELPYVEVGTCIDRAPATFKAHITSDKICAGTLDMTTALCRGDSGGGLAFLAMDRGTPRYYLRGVVSTAPYDDQACNTASYTSFTHLQKHEDFIKQFLTEN